MSSFSRSTMHAHSHADGQPASVAVPAACEVSFERLYEAHFDFIFRCLRRLGVPGGQAEDAAQDTFVILHRRLGDLRSETSARAFLFAIASRVARSYRRSGWRLRFLGGEAEWKDVASRTSPFEAAAQGQALSILEQFLEQLNEEQRTVFMLTELEELSAPEIAQALNLKLNTVYSRLRLARERFVRYLQSERHMP